MAEQLDFWDILRRIGEQYPSAIPVLSKPGVFAAYSQAINEGWTTDRLEQALQQTPYFQNTDLGQRQWDILQVVDPASARQKATLQWERFNRVKDQMGMGLPMDLATHFAFMNQAIAEDWDDAQMKFHLLAAPNLQYLGGGEFGRNFSQVGKLINDYGVQIAPLTGLKWASQLTSGTIDQNAVQGYILEQAKSRWPTIGEALNRGVTTRQYLDPYLQAAGQELGIDPANLSLQDQKWTAPLDYRDPNTGEARAMTLQEWTPYIRKTATYGYDQTPQARQQAAQFATNLSKQFGTMG